MWVDRLKRTKDKLLNPIIIFLNKQGIEASHLTIAGFIIGWIAAYFMFENHTLFIIFGVTWLILDGLDGPLARYKKKISWWQDYFADRIIYILFIIKSYLYLRLDIALIALTLYILIHGINFLLKQKFHFILPETIAIILFFFNLANHAIAFLIVIMILDILITIIFSQIESLRKIVTRD